MVSSLNTHDMPTFASFWTGRDIDQRVEWGLLSEEDAASGHASRRRIREQAARELGVDVDDVHGAGGAAAVLRAWLERLAASDAALLLVNVEDLWGEVEPQNVPGTIDGNWRRRARLTLEQLSDTAAVSGAIEAIDRLRRNVES